MAFSDNTPRSGDTDNVLLQKIAGSLFSIPTALNPSLLALSVTPVRDFFLDAARGKVTGMVFTDVVGKNPDVDIATVPEDIWFPGGLYVFPTASQTLEVLSSSASDTAAGTGARTATIVGLDINYDPITANVTLNGVTPVVISGAWFRVNDFFIVTVGTGESNIGTVTLRIAGGGNTLSQIGPLTGQAAQAIYSVRRGWTAFRTFAAIGTHRTVPATENIEFEIRTRNAFTAGPWITQNTLSLNIQAQLWQDIIPPTPPFYTERTDFLIRVSNVTANNFIATAMANFLLIDNTLP